MNILSIYAGPHNSNITYIRDNKIVCCIEEERHVRKKAGNDIHRLPELSLKYILKNYSIDWSC